MVTGANGTIDGSGAAWWFNKTSGDTPPPLLEAPPREGAGEAARGIGGAVDETDVVGGRLPPGCSGGANPSCSALRISLSASSMVAVS